MLGFLSEPSTPQGAVQFSGAVRVVRDWYNVRGRGLPTGIWNCTSSLGPTIAPPAPVPAARIVDLAATTPATLASTLGLRVRNPPVP